MGYFKQLKPLVKTAKENNELLTKSERKEVLTKIVGKISSQLALLFNFGFEDIQKEVLVNVKKKDYRKIHQIRAENYLLIQEIKRNVGFSCRASEVEITNLLEEKYNFYIKKDTKNLIYFYFIFKIAIGLFSEYKKEEYLKTFINKLDKYLNFCRNLNTIDYKQLFKGKIIEKVTEMILDDFTKVS